MRTGVTVGETVENHIQYYTHYFNGINVYRCLNASFPTYMSDILPYASDINSHTTTH